MSQILGTTAAALRRALELLDESEAILNDEAMIDDYAWSKILQHYTGLRHLLRDKLASQERPALKDWQQHMREKKK